MPSASVVRSWETVVSTLGRERSGRANGRQCRTNAFGFGSTLLETVVSTLGRERSGRAAKPAAGDGGARYCRKASFGVLPGRTGMSAGGFAELKVLAVTDEVDARLYGNAGVRHACARPDLILGCGDLPAYYLDYLVSRFDVPLFAIHGNHDAPPPLEGSAEFGGCGARWIGGRTARAGQLLLAGFDGSLRYNMGAYQSTQGEMWAAVRGLVPRL